MAGLKRGFEIADAPESRRDERGRWWETDARERIELAKELISTSSCEG